MDGHQVETKTSSQKTWSDWKSQLSGLRDEDYRETLERKSVAPLFNVSNRLVFFSFQLTEKKTLIEQIYCLIKHAQMLVEFFWSHFSVDKM